jgi:Nif-specific regulatory protein
MLWVQSPLADARNALERWDVDRARTVLFPLLTDSVPPTIRAQAELLFFRTELLTEATPSGLAIPTEVTSLRTDQNYQICRIRVLAELALANNQLCAIDPIVLPEILPEVEVLATTCLLRLSSNNRAHGIPESIRAQLSKGGSWAQLLFSLDLMAQGRGALGALNSALEAAIISGEFAAKWAILSAKLMFCASRRAYREEREVLVQMAATLEPWLLTLPTQEAVAAARRPDRLRFSTAKLLPVTDSANLVRLAIEMAGERELSRLVDLALDAALSETQAERGVLLLSDGKGGYQIAAKRQVDEDQAKRMHLSSTIARRALEHGEVVVSNDISVDASFNQIGSIETGIKSVLCVPIRARGSIEGAIYLDRRKGGRPFDESAISAAQAIGAILASSLLTAKILDDLTQRTEQLDTVRRELAQSLKTRTEDFERVQKKLGEDATSSHVNLVGHSEVMQKLRDNIKRIATSSAPVLIHGETGSGKELVARAIHDSSPRRNGPFVAINCASMSESLIEAELFGAEKGAYTNAATNRVGLFEAAHGGSLMLDEVGDMSRALQVALLRVLETGEVRRIGATKSRQVDVRIIAASHKDLAELVRLDQFRADLRFRLEVVRIEVPALRDHLEDLPEIAQVLLQAAQNKYGLPVRILTPSAIEALRQRPWSGNVRELRHVLANASLMALGHEITAQDVPIGSDSLPPPAPHKPPNATKAFTSLSPMEQKLAIERAIAETEGHRGQAAKLLGISRATFYRYLGNGANEKR